VHLNINNNNNNNNNTLDKSTLWSTKVLSQKINFFQETTLKILQVLTVVFTSGYSICKVIFTSLESSSLYFSTGICII